MKMNGGDTLHEQTVSHTTSLHGKCVSGMGTVFQLVGTLKYTTVFHDTPNIVLQ